MKKGYQFGSFYDELYRMNFWLYWNVTDRETVHHIIETEFNVTLMNKSSCAGYCCKIDHQKDNKSICIIILPKVKTIESLMDILTHEALHAVCYTLHDVGIELNKGSEEAYTYYMGYLINHYVKLMKLKIKL